MIIKETSHGVKEISEQMRRHVGANIETLQLTKRLRHTEQTNIDEMMKCRIFCPWLKSPGTIYFEIIRILLTFLRLYVIILLIKNRR